MVGLLGVIYALFLFFSVVKYRKQANFVNSLMNADIRIEGVDNVNRDMMNFFKKILGNRDGRRVFA